MIYRAVIDDLVHRMEIITQEAASTAEEIDRLVDGPSCMPVDSIDKVRRLTKETAAAVIEMKEDIAKNLK